jgi:1,5-anhydro-D-fructose reductase (1,5-anhydro-D-mannitol-forming)
LNPNLEPGTVQNIHWGMIGCGDVTEVKSGPGFQQADGSSVVAVMRRDLSKAQDYARRHGVPRAYDRAGDLIDDPDVDAVYIATPPSSHCELALAVAAAGKPCLVEKPMAMTHGECVRMLDAFAGRGVPLWVAYYRRALSRFVLVRDLLDDKTIGQLTSVHVGVTKPLATTERSNWRFDPAIAGGGLFFDLASHCVDLLDFLVAPIVHVVGFPINTAAAYPAEDVTAAAFGFGTNVVGTGIWNFNAGSSTDTITFTGSDGLIETPIFSDTDVIVTRGAERDVHAVRNPPHVHQPLIQTIVDEMHGRGRCESTGESGARASWVLDRCVSEYYDRSIEPSPGIA